MHKHTLCFIKRNEEILMLNREYDPVKGLWNGVGGKIEPGETPLASAIREIKEETDIDVKQNQIQFKGIVKWEDFSYSGGMYVYVVELQNEVTYDTPKKVSEGILDWKSVSWILSDYNYGVGEMLPKLLPEVLHNEFILEHNFVLSNHKLIDYRNEELVMLDSKFNRKKQM
ncbi:DNA mismatch repair protein MutT [Bacillus toyonensis]|jgi:8-oxo-dGTP diphosphatase|uniref:NUDIX hydrolase n=1 Tax=Bacillus TaxID=1386 RepID=UPI000BEE7BD3|nr:MULTISPECIES: 8-oxo-dGTP diphosphatase [Bacillus]AXK18635.1 8-oxo-dGTP diphosphatase [Bacillus sp. COPE52]MBJ8096734.1 8-oxo-dGTP diphosphatase [Bacillus cereus group sp. N11]PDY88563.1 DNA mismatch repair protein MutT [Bacillus toyonensis]PEJ62606.1 DNA mismatch repair protein MutT [Bacillus toyonensis]PEM78474.1 DNA mismatch repair protein MutT [Bacillus toyonensis]